MADYLRFIVEKEYNGFDMSEFDLIMKIYYPISQKTQIETVQLVDDNYKDYYYVYQLPLTGAMTREAGDIEFSLSFVKTDSNNNDITIPDYIRRIETGSYKIVPVHPRFLIPSSARIVPVNKDFTLVRGDTFMFSFRVASEFEITSITMSCKRYYSDGEYLFQKTLGNGITLEDGTYTVRIAPEDTEQYDYGSYPYDLQIVIGDDVYTVMLGMLIIKPDVTRG